MTLFLYLDPGTGSLLLYALVGILTSLLFMARKYLNALRLLFLGRNADTGDGNKFGIVIYAENGHYYSTFRPLLEEFIRNRKEVFYVTSDSNDPVFALDSEYVRTICPGNQYRTFAFLNGITADIVVSTTPHLDIYMWKRSRNVKRYVHVFHDPGSIDTYEKYGLSFYDVIIGAVPECEMSQKWLDEKRGLPPKSYYTAGCMYLDLLVAERDSLKRSVPGRCVLYAPSWGARSSLRTCGEDIIAGLLDAGWTVIFRPHPQSLTVDGDRMARIKNRFCSGGRFIIDTNPSGMESMVNSDILISDFSGIIFDYSVLFGRPVLLAGGGAALSGYEAEDLPPELQFNVPATRRIARELTDADIPRIAEIAEEETAGHGQTAGRYPIPNLGCAGKKVYEIISGIEEGLR